MRTFLYYLAFFLYALSTQAQQLPLSFRDFSSAKPIPVPEGLVYTDLDNQSWDINQLLDEGKSVYFFDMSQGVSYTDTMFLPNSAMKQFYNLHGPNGDNTAAVFVVFDFVDCLGDLDCSNPCFDFPPCNWNYPVNSGGIPIIALMYENWENFYLTSPEDYTQFFFYDALLNNGVYSICPNRYTKSYLNQFETYNKIVQMQPFLTLSDLESGLGACEVTQYENDAAILYSNADKKAANFPNQVRPLKDAIISNMGTTPLTSAVIKAYWGDSLQGSYNWTGNLLTYEFDTITLGNFVTDGKRNTLRIETSMPNGVIDQNPQNDHFEVSIDSAFVLKTDSLFFYLKSHNQVGKMGWQLFDDQGQQLQAGGCHIIYEETTNETFPVAPTSNQIQYCTSFNTNSADSVGAPNYPLGFPESVEVITKLDFSQSLSKSFTFRLLNASPWNLNEEAPYNGKLHITDGVDTLFNFSKSWYHNDFYAVFSRPDTTSVNSQIDIINPGHLKIVPNPATEKVSLQWNGKGALPQQWVVFDALGRVVWQYKPVNDALQNVNLDVNSWSDGIYFISVQLSDGQRTAKMFEVRH